MMENKNLLLAVVVSIAIVVGFQLAQRAFFPAPARTPVVASDHPSAEPAPAPPAPQGEGHTGIAPPQAAPATGNATLSGLPTSPALGVGRAEILQKAPRVRIDTPKLHGSIALVGARIDDVTLAEYHETLDPTSPEIVMFTPQGRPDAYFAETGWVPAGGAVAVPGPATRWSADGETLTPERPVTFTWDNGEGLIFKRVVSVDDNYLFSVRQSVESRRSDAVTLVPYALISRYGTPPTSGYFILYEGPLGVFDGTLSEEKYKNVQEKGVISEHTTGGWIGFTDKYWMSALIPDQKKAINARFVYQHANDANQYQVDFAGTPQTLEPGGTIDNEDHLFAGAKIVKLIDHYQDQYGIDKFYLAVDWGWFWFLTRPVFYFLNFLHGLVGNFGIAILLLTVSLKLLFFPLANKSYRAMSQMRKLQPEMTKLRERFGDDKARLNQEMMALYKREKVNPASGCLPIVIQIPVFFALYKVLFVTIEMRHAPFYGWIHDLSAPDPSSVATLFGLIPWTPPQFLMIGAWPLIMGVTMFLQQKLNPQPPDPVQAKVFMILPVVFTFMLAHFPAGLVIYWTWNNILSIVQQWVIMRRMGVKV
ncbi:MAG: membrane protein insertase YidC [Rhodospirillales bacterium]|nr:membrane protein insertase YidC [Rhodospirillales bacterium]